MNSIRFYLGSISHSLQADFGAIARTSTFFAGNHGQRSNSRNESRSARRSHFGRVAPSRLTWRGSQRTIRAVVSKGARRRPYIASGLMLAMIVVLATSCFALRGRTPEERACCASMGHDCGALAFERQCCSGEATKLQAVAPATVTIAVAAPAAVLVALLEEPSPVVRGLAISMLHQGWPIKPPGDPTYLLNSILRI
jgi:hypothetical protein